MIKESKHMFRVRATEEIYEVIDESIEHYFDCIDAIADEGSRVILDLGDKMLEKIIASKDKIEEASYKEGFSKGLASSKLSDKHKVILIGVVCATAIVSVSATYLIMKRRKEKPCLKKK